MPQLRSNRFYPLHQLRDEVDRLFTDFFGRSTGTAVPSAGGYPAVNIWESGDAVFAEAEVPGLKNEDLELSVIGNQLVIKGRRPQLDPKGVSFHRRERGIGEFSRELRLPAEVDAAGVQASLRDGVLQVTLPKAAAAKPRKIKVAQ